MNTERTYKIALIESDNISVVTNSLNDIIDGTKKSDAYEYMYAIEENIDALLDLKVYEKMTFQFCRDDQNTLGVILRIK